MPRYIDADALLKYKAQLYDENGVGFYAVGTGNILRMPTADVVEVVRCKNCMWNKSTPHNPICANDNMPKDVGFFCADGERREDEEIH